MIDIQVQRYFEGSDCTHLNTIPHTLEIATTINQEKSAERKHETESIAKYQQTVSG